MPSPVAIVDWGSLRPTPAEEKGRGVMQVVDEVRVRFGSLLIVIEPGFTSDGKSVPWYGRIWFDTWGRGSYAAITHDWLLKNRILPKWQIDLIFLWLLKEEGVPDFEAMVMYLAVRTRP